jgi:hypothetical protein
MTCGCRCKIPTRTFGTCHTIALDAHMLILPFRYMGLTDLMAEVKADSHNFSGDEATEMKVLKQVLALVQDKISEVKNQAVKW